MADNITSFEDVISSVTGDTNEAKELFKDGGIKTRTRLSKREVNIVTKLYFMCEQYGLDDFKEMLDNFLQIRVSTDGKSRKEYIQVASNKYDNQKSFLGGLFGGKRE